MPNVLKVFLENGQTKSFKYDNKTTVKVNDKCILQISNLKICLLYERPTPWKKHTEWNKLFLWRMFVLM